MLMLVKNDSWAKVGQLSHTRNLQKSSEPEKSNAYMCDGCPLPSSVKSNAGTIHALALMLQPLHILLLPQPARQIE